MKSILTSVLFIVFSFSYAQEYDYYIGSYGYNHVDVETSHDFHPQNALSAATGDKTITGAGLDFYKASASRFLSQASVGHSLEDIEYLASFQGDYEAWIDEQMNMNSAGMENNVNALFQETNNWFLSQGGDLTELGDFPWWKQFNYGFWDYTLRNKDLLRQRVAMALSELLVISFESDLGSNGDGVANYYDIFLEYAFGNYEDILTEVTFHPCMGFYLSHLNNPKSIPEDNIHPDENYAREIMQLFTIGLYELNDDGSYKIDGNGDWIPTYDQGDISEFAKIFTGLGVGGFLPNMGVTELYFGIGRYQGDMRVPMIMYEDWHEQGQKELLNGYIVPDGQSGREDINDAIAHLMSHDNVGPFVVKHLIQRMVKSNPTPGYIKRVVDVFNDNGNGIKGDMNAVVKAMLLDDEARSCSWSQNASQGMLKSPAIRYAHILKSVSLDHVYNDYWNIGYNLMNELSQHPMFSPTVFNFYLPDYQPIGGISDADLVAPEFQIHNSLTSINYFNFVNAWALWGNAMGDWETDHPGVRTDTRSLEEFAREPESLINELDIRMTGGTLTPRTRRIIKKSLDVMINGDYKVDRVELAMYLIAVSPDFAILK